MHRTSFLKRQSVRIKYTKEALHINLCGYNVKRLRLRTDCVKNFIIEQSKNYLFSRIRLFEREGKERMINGILRGMEDISNDSLEYRAFESWVEETRGEEKGYGS